MTRVSRITPPCQGCGGPHPFDTSIPSPSWNRVIRAAKLPDYLCLLCILRAFAAAREGFAAELWGDGFSGMWIQVHVLTRRPSDTDPGGGC